MSNTTVPTNSPTSTFSTFTSSFPTSSSSFDETSSTASTFSQSPTSVFSSTSSFFSSSSVALTTSTSTPATTAQVFTSRITVSPTSGSGSQSTIIITSTQTPSPTSGSASVDASSAASQASAAASSSSSRAAALATSGASSSNHKGLSTGGTVAIAVVVPIVAIAAIVFGLLFFWKRRKAKKTAEEERRKEVEDYGYNPNNDPTLPAVSSTYGENQSEMQEDTSGYRGWGATSSTQRKPSTTLGSSNRGAVGLAVSDTTSNPGGNNGPNSEGNSGDPLVTSPTNERVSGIEPEAAGALGPAPTAGSNNRDINRGPSSASSAYTGHAHSDVSAEEGEPSPNAPGFGGAYYEDNNNTNNNNNMYYNDANPNHGPYGDGTYGGSGQPIIRDVQARRNTRIEKPSVFPQQGNAGISQNF